MNLPLPKVSKVEKVPNVRKVSLRSPNGEKRLSVAKHITEMTEDEREKILGDDKKARASYEECIKNDGYNCKRDRCKEMREKKEKDENERIERLKIL